MNHEPRLPCPTCGYDLVGIFREDGTARCPECGNVADTIAVLRERERRAASWQGPALFIGVLAALIVLSTLFDGFVTLRLDPIILLYAGAIGIAAYVAAVRMLNVSPLGNIAFALGTAVIVATVAFPGLDVLLVLAWFGIFAILSVVRNAKPLRG